MSDNNFKIRPSDWKKSVLSNPRPDATLDDYIKGTYNYLSPEINKEIELENLDKAVSGIGIGSINRIGGKTLTAIEGLLPKEVAEQQALQNANKLDLLNKALKQQKLDQSIKEATEEIPNLRQIIQSRGEKQYGITPESYFENIKQLFNKK